MDSYRRSTTGTLFRSVLPSVRWEVAPVNGSRVRQDDFELIGIVSHRVLFGWSRDLNGNIRETSMCTQTYLRCASLTGPRLVRRLAVPPSLLVSMQRNGARENGIIT